MINKRVYEKNDWDPLNDSNSNNSNSEIPSHRKNEYSAGGNDSPRNFTHISKVMSGAKFGQAMDMSSLNDSPREFTPEELNHFEEFPEDFEDIVGKFDGINAMSSSNADTESDDDTQRAANSLGIGTKEDKNREHPQELDVAGDIDRNEEYSRTH